MAQQNIAQLHIDQAWVTQFLGHVNAALEMMKAKGVPLTAAQRSENPTIGPTNASMVNAGVALVQGNAGWFPGDFNRSEILSDAADRTLLLQAEGAVSQLAELYSDTLHAIGSDLLMGVYAASPYIIQSSKLSGANDAQVAAFRDYFKRNRAKQASKSAVTPAK